MGKGKYHGSESGNTIDERCGFNPRFAGGNAVDRGDCEGPLEENLEPNNADEEMRLVGDEIIAVIAGVFGLEIYQQGREEVEREAGLGVDERNHDGDEEEEEEEQNVYQLHHSLHCYFNS